MRGPAPAHARGPRAGGPPTLSLLMPGAREPEACPALALLMPGSREPEARPALPLLMPLLMQGSRHLRATASPAMNM